jgi:uncharacterized Fe-S cluster-containing radical SAM superfamily protein
MHRWKVVPLCDRQLKDVNPADVLDNGNFRKCNVYKGGGGYDRFPDICEKRLGKRYNNQFVAQLYGCVLKCPYCYVTQDGIWGPYKEFTSEELVKKFKESGQDVFHLMGGAPAIYIDHWKDIVRLLPESKVFHSDLLLVERDYTHTDIISIVNDNCLYAVSIKGGNEKEFFKNTECKLDKIRFYKNFDILVNHGVNFYLTFTGMTDDSIDVMKFELVKRYGEKVLNDSFSIDLIEYEALN